jgi:hypothetical protein
MKKEYLPGEVIDLHRSGLRLKQDDIVVYDHQNRGNTQFPTFEKLLLDHYKFDEFGGRGGRHVTTFKITEVNPVNSL